jgi:pyruvate formate lyase activating enzyme
MLSTPKKYHSAKWWKASDTGKLLCTLCPRYCEIGEGQHGFCYIRQNIAGELVSLGYGRPTGFAIDPIEKKPLNHFLPGSTILSFGTAGCNLGCKFCQNWSISKAKIDDSNAHYASPTDVVSLAFKYSTPSIAFTYNDPVIFGEFARDISDIAVREGIKTVFVTAGYITEEARDEVFKNCSAANVDLKAFTERFYKDLANSSLKDVLNTLVWMKEKTNIWLEITTLLIPDENDSSQEINEMTKWIVSNLGDRVPLHFTAFHPDFKMKDKERTKLETLHRARNIALENGMKFVYTGNVHDHEGQATYCPSCSKKIIERDWHSVTSNLISNGKCSFCDEKIDGIFI